MLAVQACAHCINWFLHCCCSSWVALLRSLSLSLRSCSHCEESVSVPLRVRHLLRESCKNKVAVPSQALEPLLLLHCTFSERHRLRQASPSWASAADAAASAQRLSSSQGLRIFSESIRMVSTQSH